MNDIMWSMFSVVATFFEMMLIMIFFKIVFQNKNIRVNKIIFYVCFILSSTLSLVLSQFNFIGFFNILKTFILLLLLTLLYRSKWIIRFFATLSFLVFLMISEFLSYGIISLTIDKIEESEIVYYSLLLSKMIILIIVLIVGLILKNNMRAIKFKDYLSFLVTPIISFATVIMISFEFDTGEVNSTVGICFATIGLLIINLVVYYLLENIIDANEIREKQSRLELQINYQEKKYHQASDSFKRIGGIIHDTNKHLVYLKECLKLEDYSEAKRYIETAITTIDKSYKRINTGYLPIDALVSNAYNIALGNNINFKTDINVEKERIMIERYDICVALGNMLDNALESCYKVKYIDNKFIFVLIKTTENSLVVIIENSVERRSDNSTNLEKKDKLLHGYGLKNIETIAEKYKGVFTISFTKTSCEATLVLPI